MIYLHCGWPKTGTTSLQAALAKHRDLLAAAGICYPRRIAQRERDAHHDVVEALTSSLAGRGAALDELFELLARYRDENLVLSSEFVTMWLMGPDEKCDLFLRFIQRAQQLAPVACSWTLRRFDDLIHSGYVHQLADAPQAPPLPTQFADGARQARLFSAMCKIEVALKGGSTYVKYDPDGRHNAELMRSFGLPDRIVATVERELRSARRLNVSRTRKQLAAVVNADRLSASSGAPLDRRAMLKAFDRGEFRFDDDGPCELLGRDGRQTIRRLALKIAGERGFAPYVDFFEGDEPEGCPAPAGLDPDVMSDPDLARLAAHFREPISAPA